VTPETGISGNFKDTEYKESGGGYDGPDPATGLYPAKLTSVGPHTTSDTSIVWTFDITDGKYAGWRGWTYSDMDNAKWKTQQILVALGVIEPNGDINKTYDQIMKEAEPCRIRTVSESYEGEHRAKIRSLLKGLGASADAADEEEEEEDADFDDKKPAKKAAPARGSRSRKAKDPEPEPEEEEEEDGDEEEGIDLDALEEELEDMSLADLKKKAKEFGATRTEIKDLDGEELIDLILDKAEEQNPSF
jgi:hypothetical protein